MRDFAASFSITVSINDFFSGNFISVTICYDISDLHFIPSNHRAMRPLKLVYQDTLQFLNTEMRFSLTQTKTFHVSKSQTWRTIGNDPQSKRSNLNPRACMACMQTVRQFVAVIFSAQGVVGLTKKLWGYPGALGFTMQSPKQRLNLWNIHVFNIRYKTLKFPISGWIQFLITFAVVNFRLV